MHRRGAHSLRNQHAFTLAEVMMATVVTLVALVGLIAAVTVGSEMLDVSRKQTVAMQILRNEIEQVHLKDWSAVSTLPVNASITINDAGTGLSAGSATDQLAFALTNYTSSTSDDDHTLMSVAKGFTCTVAITPVPLRANLLKLKYTVTWTSGNQRKSYTRKSMTFYGKTGLNLYYQK